MKKLLTFAGHLSQPSALVYVVHIISCFSNKSVLSWICRLEILDLLVVICFTMGLGLSWDI